MDLDADAASATTAARLQPSSDQQTSNVQQSLDGLSVSPSNMKTTQRVLACVLCQQRKIRCDRKFPCSNCSKSQTQCVPATQNRRRKRRFPERELLDRLRRYEELLRQNKVPFESLHKDSSPNVKDSPYGNDGSDDDVLDTKTLGSPDSTAKSANLFEARDIWDAIKFSKQHEGENDTDEAPEQSPNIIIGKSWDSLGDDNILFGSRHESVDLSTIHPEPAHMFRLWQIYLDNVNPILKVTHTPTLQPRIIEAVGDMRNIEPTLEAVMFGIYCMALVTLSSEDCQNMFGTPRDTLETRFRFGCQQALLNCRFLSTTDLECLTAFYLYLHSLAKACSPRSLASMLGIATRTAMRIGVDSELHNSKCPVLEAEMRRRLWYSLVLFDARVSELAMYKNACLNPTWDCKPPLNVNDIDLRADMRQPPSVQVRTSEALFIAVRSALADFVRHASFYLDFTTPALKAVARGVREEKSVSEFARSIERDCLDHCDPGNPLHYLTIWSTRSLLFRFLLLAHYSKCSSTVQITTEQADEALSHALGMVDCDTKLHNAPMVKGFHWFFRYQFPALGYIHIIEGIKKRPTSPVARHAWVVLSENFVVRHAVSDPLELHGPFGKHFIKNIMQAWKSMQTAASLDGHPLTEPKMVQLMASRAAEMGQVETPGTETGTEPSGDAMSMSTYIDEFLSSMPAGYPPQNFIYGFVGTPGPVSGMDTSLQGQTQQHMEADLQMGQPDPWTGGGGYW